MSTRVLRAVLAEVRAVKPGEELAAWRLHGGRWRGVVLDSGVPGSVALAGVLSDDAFPAGAVAPGQGRTYPAEFAALPAAARITHLKSWLEVVLPPR